MFMNRRRQSGWAVAFLLMGSMLLVGPSSTLGASALPFRIGGAVTPIASPDDFTGSSIQRASPAQSGAIQFDFVRFYVVSDATGEDRYSFSLEAITDAAIATNELAFDPEGHRQLLAVGIPTPESLQDLLESAPAASASASPGDVARAGSIQPLTLTSAHNGFTTVWRDPLDLVVNEVDDDARFYYDGTHVSSLTGGDSRNWASWNGWWEVHHSIAASYNASHTLGWVQTNDQSRRRVGSRSPPAARPMSTTR